MSFIRLLIAFFIPPLAVYMQFGWSRHLALNILLTLIGIVPGIIHAVYIMAARRPGLATREQFDHPSQREQGLTPTDTRDRSVST